MTTLRLNGEEDSVDVSRLATEKNQGPAAMKAIDTPTIPHSFDGDFSDYERNYLEVRKLDKNFSIGDVIRKMPMIMERIRDEARSLRLVR
jgi:hypothetical protein